MKGPVASLALSFIALAFGTAHAADPVAPDIDGELHVTLKNAEYVKVQVNGEDYENIEFEKNGKVLIVKGLSLSLERNAITLRPTDSTLKEAELEVVLKDFKKKRKGRVVFLIATKTVAFDKAPNVAPPDETPPPPKPDPVAPPPPAKDDL